MQGKEYIANMMALLEKIDADKTDEAVEAVLQALYDQKAIFVAGNGGSAATANHFAADFGKNVVQFL